MLEKHYVSKAYFGDQLSNETDQAEFSMDIDRNNIILHELHSDYSDGSIMVHKAVFPILGASFFI